MPTEKKVKMVAGLQETFSRCTVGVMTDYRGLTTTELNELRGKLRDVGVEYHVVKNSLAQIAAKNAGIPARRLSPTKRQGWLNLTGSI